VRVSSMRERLAAEVAAMQARELTLPEADHLMVEAIRNGLLPASRLPKVLEAWGRPRHQAIQPRTAWSFYNAFTDLARCTRPRAPVQDTMLLTHVYRREILLGG
jgi:hypothetical protein